MPRYDLNIAIIDTILYIVPSLPVYGRSIPNNCPAENTVNHRHRGGVSIKPPPPTVLQDRGTVTSLSAILCIALYVGHMVKTVDAVRHKTEHTETAIKRLHHSAFYEQKIDKLTFLAL